MLLWSPVGNPGDPPFFPGSWLYLCPGPLPDHSGSPITSAKVSSQNHSFGWWKGCWTQFHHVWVGGGGGFLTPTSGSQTPWVQVPSLVVQWLGRPASTARLQGLIPGQGAKILQITSCGKKKKKKASGKGLSLTGPPSTSDPRRKPRLLPVLTNGLQTEGSSD